MLSNKNDKKTMKKIYIICLLGAALLFTSCSDQRTVNRTANAFLQSFYVENNFSAAKVFATRATQANIIRIEEMFVWNPNSEANRFRSFRIDGSDVRTTRAVVFYTLDDDVQRRLNLSKTDGRWLVDMPEGTSLNPAFSLSPVNVSGGFASAQSDWMRIGDAPTTDNN